MIIGTVIRRDTTENWERSNAILDNCEMGYDLTQKIIKIGDGVTPWKKLKGILEVEL